MAMTIQKGHARGETLRETDEKNILAGIAEQEAILGKNPASRTANFHREWLLAARAELALRRARRFTAGLRSAKAVRDALVELAAVAHLVTPSRECVALLDGTEIAVTFLEFDSEIPKGRDSNADVYRADSGDGLSFTKGALNKIAQAAAIDWLPQQCGRVDDRSHPHYVEFKAAGKWRRFDNTEHVEDRCRAADLRDKSVEVAGLNEAQLARARKFILPTAESKAKNRVVRELGVELSYTAAELEKPFAVLRLVHTGRTKDKALRREFALNTQRSMAASASAMYGAPVAPLTKRAPPPVGLTGSELDDHYWENRDAGHAGAGA